MVKRLGVLVVGCAALACGSQEPPSRPPVDPQSPLCAPLASLSVIREVPHLGSGHELLVRAEDRNGQPLSNDVAGCFAVDHEGKRVTATVAPRALTSAYTLLLVDPGQDAAENALVRATIQRFVERRPPGERIGIWRWGAAARPLAPIEARRDRLPALMAVGLSPAPGERYPLGEAVMAAGSALAAVGGTALPALRTLVVISPRANVNADAAALEGAQPHLVLLVAPTGATRSGHRLALGTDSAATAAALSMQLDAWAARGHYGVGLCNTEEAREVTLTGGAVRARIAVPHVLPENDTAGCQADVLATGDRKFPRQISLLYSAEERRKANEIYERKYNPALMGPTDEDFPLRVRLSPQHQPLQAKAHWRGQSSYHCSRRNMSLNLDGDAERFVLPGSAAQKFHLVSLCNDRLYLRSYTALTLMAGSDMGLFPVPFDYVELDIDGESQGVYMLTENVSDSVRLHVSGVTAVVRRAQVNALPVPEVKWALGGHLAGAEAYGRLLEGLDTLRDEALERTLRARLDLDQYMRWLALMNLLGSGDYIDEVFFYAVATADSQGHPREHWAILGWDQDDLFAECHTKTPIPDPHGLLQCAEAELDGYIIADARLYRQYADIVERMARELTPERFRQTLGGSAGKLLAHLSRREVLAGAMDLPGWSAEMTPAMAQAAVNQEVDELVGQFTANRTRILESLTRYRSIASP